MDQPPRRRWTKWLAAGAAGIALGLAASLWMGAKLTAAAPALAGTPPADLHAQAIVLSDGAGRAVHGWNAPVKDGAGVVVLAHGIRGSRRDMVPRARFLADHGFSSVLIDLHAHGESDGETISLGVREAESVRAAVRFAREAYSDQPLAVLGVSLGGAATALALPMEIDALILESVFPDVKSAIQHRVSARLGPALAVLPAWLLELQIRPRLGVAPGEISPVETLGKACCPVFVIAGANDPHTPKEETQRLHAAAPEGASLWLVSGAGHVDLHEAAGASYESRLLTFLADALPPKHR